MQPQTEMPISAHTNSMQALEGLTPEIYQIIEKKYGAREALHFNFREENPVMMVGFDPTNARHHGMERVFSWYKEHMNCQAIFVDSAVPAQIRNGETREGMALPLTNDAIVNVNPYFTTGYSDREDENITYSGLESQKSRFIKNKINFSAEMLAIGNTGEPDHNFALPFDVVAFSKENEQQTQYQISDKIASISYMYDEINAKIIMSGDMDLAEDVSKGMKPGVVLRPATMDGGFGNIFINQDRDGWHVNIGNEHFVFQMEGEAMQKVTDSMEDGWEYVMTRKVSSKLSPSVGIHFDQDGFHIMQPTEQKMDDSKTCVGGWSINLSENGDKSRRTVQEKLERLTFVIVNELISIDELRGNGHIGLDWVIASEIEQEVIDFIANDEELKAKYGEEFAKEFCVEMNPRHTLISHVTPSLARAVRVSRGDQSYAVTQQDINALYGMPTEAGTGAFAVFDFVNMEHAGSDMLGETDNLIEYINQFNQIFQGEVVMIPRIDAYDKDGHTTCSIAMAAVPDHTGANVETLKNIKTQMQSDGKVKLIDIREFIQEQAA